MNPWMREIQRFINDESGQATLEYMMIVAAAAAGAVGFIRVFLEALDSGINFFGGVMEKDLRTGRAPVDIWTN